MTLGLVFTASLLEAQHYGNVSVENMQASLLAVPLGKAHDWQLMVGNS